MKNILSLTCLAVLLAACSDENSKFRGNFLAGCIQSGLPKSTCACMFDKISEKYSTQELEAIDKQGKAPSEAFSNVVAQSALVCRNK